ncbi:hypothetical protein T4C_9191 [Trichinella pseudospiralis]|uniref:Uncharacterized protein n=1 Tax=Trichinella pseudospiralis TaxID=6337 RepID=A0A0V1K1B2_TRIPS|nr:hypothetical protein T4C_9191 [Trichinella pseudospiralis]
MQALHYTTLSYTTLHLYCTQKGPNLLARIARNIRAWTTRKCKTLHHNKQQYNQVSKLSGKEKMSAGEAFGENFINFTKPCYAMLHAMTNNLSTLSK